MRHLLIGFLLFFLSATAVQGGNNKTVAFLNLNKSGVALSGYDPVSYHMGTPVPGKKTFAYTYQGATYYFSKAGNLRHFKENPSQYLPAFGGWCAWAMLDGDKVKINPKTFKIINGRTYLFYHTFFVNTLTKWNKRAKNQGENILVQKAAAAWQKIKNR